MSKPTFFDDLKLPVIAAPLFLVSGPKLDIECCKSGIVGTFPALNQRTTKGFEEWVIQIKNELSEFTIFLNSGGVINNTFYIPTNRFFFNFLNYIDRILIFLLPGIFALNRSIVLRKIR